MKLVEAWVGCREVAVGEKRAEGDFYWQFGDRGEVLKRIPEALAGTHLESFHTKTWRRCEVSNSTTLGHCAHGGGRPHHA